MFEIKNIQFPYSEKLREELAYTYITEPFFNTLNEGGIKIITAPTAFGKNYSIWNYITPRYLQEFGDIHIHVAPHVETIDRKEIDDYLQSITNMNTFVIHNGDLIDFKFIRTALEENYKIVLILSDRKLVELSYETSPLYYLIQNYKGRVLLTRDEMSYGTTTHKDNYLMDKGYSNERYKGTYMRDLLTLYSFGANTYGFTATPTREHLKELESLTSSHLRVINKWPDKEELIPFQKWYNELEVAEYTDTDYADGTIIEKELQRVNDEIYNRERDLRVITAELGIEDHHKFTGLVSVQTYIPHAKNPRITIHTVLNTIKENPHIINPSYTIVIPTHKGWYEYNHKGEKTGKSGKGNEWIELMNDPNSKARIMVGIYKGNYGINIPSLCIGLSLRNPKPKTKDYTHTKLIHTGLQILGRLGRSNLYNMSWGKLNSLSEIHGYSKILHYLMVKNTFTFKGVGGENNYWYDVIQTYTSSYGNSYTQMIQSLVKWD